MIVDSQTLIIIVVLFLLFMYIKHYIPKYFEEKAKNTATKEDIQGITNKIEEIKAQYQLLLENYKAKHSLRMAAIEKRLAAHQEAFCLWRKLNGALNDEIRLADLVFECDKWWGENSLYLEPEARQAFLDAWVSAKDLHNYKEANEIDLVRDCYNKLNNAGNIITTTVELPQLNEPFSNSPSVPTQQLLHH